MKILLADDQLKVRSALRLLLEQEPGLSVVGESADAIGVLLAVTDKEPDLLLLDWELPGLPPDQLLRLIRHERPSLEIIAMSSRPEVAQQTDAMGVNAFLSKSDMPDRVLATIKNLAVDEVS